MYLSKTPTITFDPSKKEHRAAARAFLKRKAWIDSPLRFTHDAKYGSVASQIEAKLLDWYVAQEEEKDAKKAKPKSPELMVIGKPKSVPVEVVGDKELAFAMMGIAAEYPGTVCHLNSRRKSK